jgi:hypothetical protein
MRSTQLQIMQPFDPLPATRPKHIVLFHLLPLLLLPLISITLLYNLTYIH